MPKLIDLTGQTFGRTVVLRRGGQTRKKEIAWECLCSCGTRHVAAGADLRYGDTKSCGCLQPEAAAAANTTHGNTANGRWSPEYMSWSAMIARCYRTQGKTYHRYGGRGITVCDRWRNSFQAFLEDMGPRPPGLTLERKENDVGYSPENCVWDTHHRQARNRSSTHALKYQGRSQSLAAWAEEVGLPYATLSCRINQSGWSVEKALTTVNGPSFKPRRTNANPERPTHLSQPTGRHNPDESGSTANIPPIVD